MTRTCLRSVTKRAPAQILMIIIYRESLGSPSPSAMQHSGNEKGRNSEGKIGQP
jgi:hypothetical protein